MDLVGIAEVVSAIAVVVGFGFAAAILLIAGIEEGLSQRQLEERLGEDMKLRAFVQEVRDREDRQTYFEWFQWLAERMLERESRSAPMAAYVQHRDWRGR